MASLFSYDNASQFPNGGEDNFWAKTTVSPGNETNVGGCNSNACFVVVRIIQPIVFGVITLIGILGNALVIYVILSRQKMRTVTNLLLLNLAIADLSFVIICPPFTAYQMATNKWPLPGLFGQIICKLMHYLLNVTVYVTIYTLVLISMIRYLTIVHNNATMRYRTRKNIMLMVFGIWVLMCGANTPIIIYHGVHTEYGVDSPICEVLSFEAGRAIYTIFFIFAYVIPLIMIAVLSLCILHHIKKQRSVVLSKRKSKTNKKKKQASQVLILVVVIFAIFWLPIQIYLLLSYYGLIEQTEGVVMSAVLWPCLAYFNSCVNPIIYNYASQDFRGCFREVICCTAFGRQYDESDRQSFCTKTTHHATALCTNGQNVDNHTTAVTYLKDDVSDADDV